MSHIYDGPIPDTVSIPHPTDGVGQRLCPDCARKRRMRKCPCCGREYDMWQTPHPWIAPRPWA